MKREHEERREAEELALALDQIEAFESAEEADLLARHELNEIESKFAELERT